MHEYIMPMPHNSLGRIQQHHRQQKSYTIRTSSQGQSVKQGRQEQRQLMHRSASLPIFSQYRGEIDPGAWITGTLWGGNPEERTHTGFTSPSSLNPLIGQRPHIRLSMHRHRQPPHKAQVRPQLEGERYVHGEPFVKYDPRVKGAEAFDPVSVLAPNVRLQMEEEERLDPSPGMVAKQERVRYLREQRTLRLRRREAERRRYRQAAVKRSTLDAQMIEVNRPFLRTSDPRHTRRPLTRPPSRLAVTTIDRAQVEGATFCGTREPREVKAPWVTKDLLNGRARTAVGSVRPRHARVFEEVEESDDSSESSDPDAELQSTRKESVESMINHSTTLPEVDTDEVGSVLDGGGDNGDAGPGSVPAAHNDTNGDDESHYHLHSLCNAASSPISPNEAKMSDNDLSDPLSKVLEA